MTNTEKGKSSAVDLAFQHLQTYQNLTDQLNDVINTNEDANFDELYISELYWAQQAAECGCEECLQRHQYFLELVRLEEQRLSPIYYGDEIVTTEEF